jgi:hypothetical protein
LSPDWKVLSEYALKNSFVGQRKYSVAIAHITHPLTDVNSAIRPRGKTPALHFVSFELAFVSSAVCPDIFSCALKMIFTPFTRVNVSILKSHHPKSMAMTIQQIAYIVSCWQSQSRLIAHRRQRKPADDGGAW